MGISFLVNGGKSKLQNIFTKRCFSQKYGPLIALIFLNFFVSVSCALIFSKTLNIEGRVRLSDNPVSGHGGVRIFTPSVNTFSKSDGNFVLEATITRKELVTIFFEKAGYLTESRVLEVEFDTEEDPKINVGTVTLQKI